MGNLFHGPTPFILLFLILLLFGAPKLPGLAKSLGQSMKILKKEVSSDGDAKDGEGKDAAAEATTVTETSAPAAPAAQSDDELAKAKAEAAAAK
ncbi:MAG: twin-arginine translocase TatA/TatE family subunit, partial [Actinobacteria bacterium]|nr:twin-arginine translocase TatA/TatE family subunit [Actinomycetota bacterium]